MKPRFRRLLASLLALLPSVAFAQTTTSVTYENTTPATNGTQSPSPNVGLMGQGYQAGSVNASARVGMQWEMQPVQGTTFPAYPRLMLQAMRGGTAWQNAFSISFDETSTVSLRNEATLWSYLSMSNVLALSSPTGIITIQNLRPGTDFGADLCEGTVRRCREVNVRAYYGVQQTPTYSANINIDCSQGELAVVSLTGNLGSWTISNPTRPQRCSIVFAQDATGGRTIGTPPTNIKWLPSTYLGNDHAAPTLSTDPSKRDLINIMWDGTAWVETSRNFNY